MEQTPFLSKERRNKKGDKKGRQEGRQAPEPELEPARSWNQQEAGNDDGTDSFLSKERRDKKGDTKGDQKGDKPRNQSRKQEAPENHDGTKTVSSKNWEPHSARELFGEKEKKGK